MASEHLSIREVAESLGVHTKTVRRMIGDGSLSAVNISRGRRPTWRVAAEDLERFRQMRRTGFIVRRRAPTRVAKSKWYD